MRTDDSSANRDRHPSSPQGLARFLFLVLVAVVLAYYLSRVGKTRLVGVHGDLLTTGWESLTYDRLDEAEQAFRTVMQSADSIDGEKADALLGLGNVASSRGDHDEAITAFREIVTRFPDMPDLVARALHNLAIAYTEKDDLEAAEQANIEILGLGVDERAPSGDPNLMGNPYAGFKHRASRSLASMYFDQGRYEEAQEYHVLATKKYPYSHFCGNALFEESLRITVFQSQIYEKQGRLDEAIATVLPKSLGALLVSNAAAADQAASLMRQRYNAAELDSLFSQALAGLSEDSRLDEHSYYLDLLGVRLPIYDWSIDDEDRVTAQELRQFVLKSRLVRATFEDRELVVP